MIVLDTHVLIWLIEGDEQLGTAARALIEDARADDGVCISAITPWEIAMLDIKGRVRLSKPIESWIRFVLGAPGIGIEHIDPMIAVDAGKLPDGIHGDPADRIIIATARALGCPLLTADTAIRRFAAKGHVAVIDAGR